MKNPATNMQATGLKQTNESIYLTKMNSQTFSVIADF